MSNVIEMKSKEKTEKTIEKDETKLLRNWYVWAIIMAGLSSLFFIVILWCTNIFQNILLSNLIIQNGTKTFDLWEHPPVKLINKYYVYNYTNAEDFESGKAKKLTVQQLGPYIYRETKVRVNVQVHDNGTVSYQEKKSFELEEGDAKHDIITIPNIMLLMSIASVRNLYYPGRLMFTIMLSTMEVKTFIKVNVDDFLWGYDDNLFDILSDMGMITSSQKKFGVLVENAGVLKNRFMINTGSDDIDNLGIIEGIDGRSSLNIWGDEKCDKIDATDGTMFPPKWIKNQSIPLNVYIGAICKALSFKFHGYDQVQGVPSLRYKFSLDSFQFSSTETCFCPKTGADSWERKCPPLGTLSASPCHNDMPIIISLPHFYGAERSLIESIDGLKPEEDLHESTYDLHQFLAAPMNATLRLQLNVEVKKVLGVPFMGKFTDGMILPIFWNENTVDAIPQEFINIFYGVHVLTTVVEAAFRWGSIFLFLSSICALYVARRNHRIQRYINATV